MIWRDLIESMPQIIYISTKSYDEMGTYLNPYDPQSAAKAIIRQS
jgi:hypothetical protein